MTDTVKLTAILLPLLILGAGQVVYALVKRRLLARKFVALFAISGALSMAFALTLWLMGMRMLS